MFNRYRLWQQQHQQDPNPNPNPNPNFTAGSLILNNPSSSTVAATAMFPPCNIVSSSSSAVAITCQDCGNQAKKDCLYRRCRTCCKSQQFSCPTHVKSTWVPTARRREKQQLSGAMATTSASTTSGGSKKQRLLLDASNNSHTSTSSHSFDTSSSHHQQQQQRRRLHQHQDAGFRENLPLQIQAPAVFRCVRVTSIDDGEDEYAYQAMVNIRGHVFKGFLYDQGIEDNNNNTTNTGEGGGGDDDYSRCRNSNNSTLPNLSELHLGGVAGGRWER